MTGRIRSVVVRTGRGSPEPNDCFECTHCEAAYADLPDDCPECGEIVVRVVEPRPVPDL